MPQKSEVPGMGVGELGRLNWTTYRHVESWRLPTFASGFRSSHVGDKIGALDKRLLVTMEIKQVHLPIEHMTS